MAFRSAGCVPLRPLAGRFGSAGVGSPVGCRVGSDTSEHLRHVLKEYVEQYNAERPHQARGNVPLPDADAEEPRILPLPSGEVKCRERLGGLLRHYHRAA